MTGESNACGEGGRGAENRELVDERRRAFLRGGTALAATAVAPGVTLYVLGSGVSNARSPDEPASAKVRWGLLVDASKCAEGCNACVAACSRENGWHSTMHPATDAQWIRKVRLHDPRRGATISPPVMCQHCASPPCTDVCPTGASFKRADGIVLVNKHICIGCRYCMMACPYKARSFIHAPIDDQRPDVPRGKGTVESCTLCVHRVDVGRAPACVESCTAEGAGALLFGDINDPKSEISTRIAEFPSAQIRGDLGLDPAIRYRNL
jgi:molybdopterin-containing oxidoreductase family iron-sulfur binding subunit